MILEILKNCGVEEEKANDVVKAMAEAKIYTTNLENVDVRYNKLQEQKKQLEEASKNYEKQLKDLTKNNADVEFFLKLMKPQDIISYKKFINRVKKDSLKQSPELAQSRFIAGGQLPDYKGVKTLVNKIRKIK